MTSLTAEEARRRTLAFLAEHGIPSNPGLPLIEDRDDLDPPTADAVARRAVVLTGIIASVGFGLERSEVVRALEGNGLWADVSPLERTLLTKDEPSRQEVVNASWMTECMQVLMWGLGRVELDHFQHCDDDLARHSDDPRKVGEIRVLAAPELRPFDEIYQQCDMLYCLHWAARNQRLGGPDVPYEEGIVMERHRAINWLAGVESEWDEVTTDT